MKSAKQRPIARVTRTASKKPKRPQSAESAAAETKRISRAIRKWRQDEEGGSLTRDQLAAQTGRCIGTIRNWERQKAPREPRVSDVRAMERAKPGIVVLLFPEAF